MYDAHFGLELPPFRMTPDTRLFYDGGGRGELLEALVYAINSGEGMVKVVGEVGAGKTMMCRMLEDRLPEHVEIVYLANPSLNPDDILQAIALEMDLPVEPDANRVQVMHALQQRLLEKHSHNRRVVMFVEEAQSMPLDTLEEIRLLSNLETKQDKLLQIVLFGQPELDDNLSQPRIRQLRERITHSFYLPPFSQDETREYLNHRLRCAGYKGPELFGATTTRPIAHAADGLTRRINILADKAMLAAFAEDTHDIARRHIRIAIEDSHFSRASPGRTRLVAGAGLTLAVVAVAVIAWSVLDPPLPRLAGLPGEADGAAATPAGDARVVDARTAPPAEPPAPDPAPRSAVAPADALATAEPPSSPVPSSPSAVAAVPPVAAAEPGAINREAVPAPVAAPSEPTAPPPRAPTPAPVSAPAVTGAVEPATPSTEPGPEPLAAGGVAREVASVQATPVPMPPQGAAPVPPAPSAAGTGPAGSPESASPAAGAALPVAAASGAAVQWNEPRRRYGPLLSRRMDATRSWLERVDTTHYSIQLFLTGLDQHWAVEEFLSRRRLAGEIEEVFVYETEIDARPVFSVMFREFEQYIDAKKALESLPGPLKYPKPFVRILSDVRPLP